VKLLLDEMWSRTIAAQLRLRGHDIEAVLERDELIGKADEVIFATAQSEQRAIVTENVPHFRSLAEIALLSGRTHSGLVLTTNRAFPRSNPRTPGRVVIALDALLLSDIDIRDREVWLS
jgi:predicted nuclease of predicted toxin-antitoxin system